MTSSPRWCTPLIIVSTSLLAWIVVLSLGRRFLLGASLTGGWLIIGMIFTLAAVGIVIMVKELKDAVALFDPFSTGERTARRAAEPTKVPRPVPAADPRDARGLLHQRTDLGLGNRQPANNRRRQARKETVELAG